MSNLKKINLTCDTLESKISNYEKRIYKQQSKINKKHLFYFVLHSLTKLFLFPRLFVTISTALTGIKTFELPIIQPYIPATVTAIMIILDRLYKPSERLKTISLVKTSFDLEIQLFLNKSSYYSELKEEKEKAFNLLVDNIERLISENSINEALYGKINYTFTMYLGLTRMSIFARPAEKVY